MAKSVRGEEPTKGAWSEAEDQRLLALVAEFDCNWSEITTRMGSRNAKQCRERYTQNLRPGLDHGPITDEEAAFIKDQVGRIGNRWADIARMLGNRSDNAVKNWHNGTINRRNRAQKKRQDTLAAGNSNGNASQSVLSTAAPIVQRALPPPVAYAGPSHRQGTYFAPATVQPSDRQLPPLYEALSSQIHLPPDYSRERDVESCYFQNHTPNSASADCANSYYDRRTSIYTAVGSPRSDSAEHAYVPSLVSDTGSPSVRESSSHAPSTPIMLPPLVNYDAPSRSLVKDDHSPHSPPSMSRSWSGLSEQSQPPLATLHPPPFMEMPYPGAYVERRASGGPETYKPLSVSINALLNRDPGSLPA